MQNSLFDFLGFEPETQESEKKAKKAAVKNEGAKAEDKKSKDDKKDQKQTCTLPVKVVTAFSDTVSYGAGSFVTPQPEAKDVFEKFIAEHPEYPKSLCGYYQKNKTTVVVYLKSMYASEKTDIKANAETKYVLGGRNLDLSAFMTNAECEIKATDLIEAFQKEYPKYGKIKLCYSITENTVTPYFAENALYSSLPLPVDVVFWNHEDFTVTEEDLNNLNKKGKPDEEADEEADADEESDADDTEVSDEETDEEAAETSDKNNARYISANELLKVVEGKYPEFKGVLKLLYSKEQKTVIVSIKEVSNGSSTPSVPKVTMYPTDAEVSLFVHIHLKLQPNWFGGKTEISEAEFKKFLEERYPEFSPERTLIVYDAKKKLIMPCLKSSSKGADIATTDEEEEKLKASPFPFVREYADGSKYRVESTPVADFRVCMNGDGSKNKFDLKLPKLPATLIHAAREFFRAIYAEFGTEAFLQLFYDEVDESFFWSLPKQKVTASAVEAERNPLKEREFILVADFHSHGRHPAFWSGTDNQDEKGTRLFGVMGFRDGDSKKYRVGCGGYFFDISEEDFIDTEDLDLEASEDIVDFLLKRKEHIAVIF